MVFSPPPQLSGTLAPLYPYLYDLSQRLNLMYEDCSFESMWQKTEKAVTSEGSALSGLSSPDLKTYAAVKDMVIKTAQTAVKNVPSSARSLSGDYLLKSQFGTYFENAKVTIEETPWGITELYNYSAFLDSVYGSFMTDIGSYVKTGLLYYDNTEIPVYGVGVGTLYKGEAQYGKTEDTEFISSKTYYEYKDGAFSVFEHVGGASPSYLGLYEKVISKDGNIFAAFTPSEIAFYYGDTKKAYINEKAAYFPNAVITGGSLNIGSAFSVSENGTLYASGAEISGDITALSLNIENAVITGTLSADAIQGGTLDFSKITAKSISANAVTSGTLSASRISGGTLDCSYITVKNLSADAITSGVLLSTYMRLGGQLYVYKSDFTTVGGIIGYFTGFDGSMSTGGIGMKGAVSGTCGQISCTTAGAKMYYSGWEFYLNTSGLNMVGPVFRSYGGNIWEMPAVRYVKGTVTSAWSDMGLTGVPESAAVVVSPNYSESDYSYSYTVKTRYYGGAWQWCISGSSGSVSAAAVAAWTQ